MFSDLWAIQTSGTTCLCELIVPEAGELTRLSQLSAQSSITFMCRCESTWRRLKKSTETQVLSAAVYLKSRITIRKKQKHSDSTPPPPPLSLPFIYHVISGWSFISFHSVWFDLPIDSVKQDLAVLKKINQLTHVWPAVIGFPLLFRGTVLTVPNKL